MRNDPLVSVIIPTFNRAHTVGSALASALAQTYKQVEIIVVDDGSRDNTWEVISHFEGVNYILQPQAGQASARNNGLRHASGAFVATLDSDDTWHPSFLEHCMARLQEGGFDFVFANWVQKSRYEGDRDYLRTFPALTPFLEKEKDGWVDLCSTELRQLYLQGCPSPSSSALIRRSSLVNGWDSAIHIGDDWAMFLDMILKKECRVSFSLQQLWTKNIDDTNVYDGREWEEVLRLLYVEDLEHLLTRYNTILEEKEIRQFERLHLKGMLDLALYTLFKRRDMSGSFDLLKRSFNRNAFQALRELPVSVKTCLDRKRKTLQALKN
jgi:glycosyltransferase involved in cell wall biosynthesis